MRDAIVLFERELIGRDGRSMMPESSGFVGMMEQDPESIYDLLATPENTDTKSDFEGSNHPLRECNMLHLLEDGVASAEDAEDDAYLIPRTPREHAEYDQERLERARAREADRANERRDAGCASPQHLDAEGARAMPIFPRASQNVTAATMLMRTASEPSTDEGKHIHQELRDLLETAVVQ